MLIIKGAFIFLEKILQKAFEKSQVTEKITSSEREMVEAPQQSLCE